jgi:hypothetical protein
VGGKQTELLITERHCTASIRTNGLYSHASSALDTTTRIPLTNLHKLLDTLCASSTSHAFGPLDSLNFHPKPLPRVHPYIRTSIARIPRFIRYSTYAPSPLSSSRFPSQPRRVYNIDPWSSEALLPRLFSSRKQCHLSPAPTHWLHALHKQR